MISHFPQGKQVGNYILCGDIRGSKGKSFKYNLDNDLWCDFATGQSGRGIESLLYMRGDKVRHEHPRRRVYKSAAIIDEGPPPYLKPVDRPDRRFRVALTAGGRYSNHWEYRNGEGEICFYVVRYDYPAGKETIPYSNVNGRWAPKAWQGRRPLYNSDKIKDHKKIMIVEGEKCVDATKVFPDYLGVTWSGGSNAIKKTDWSLLVGKDIAIIPDNDLSGFKAAREIANIVNRDNKVRIINIAKLDMDLGYDLADLVEDGFSPELFSERYKL